MRLLPIIVFALLLGSADALIFPNFCPSLFPTSQPGIFVPGGAQTGLISISLLIVILILAALGIVYALGTGFGFDSLKGFARTEFAESVFTIVIIAFVAAGLGFAGGAVSFLTNLGAIGASELGISAQGITTSQSLYSSICQNYLNSGVESMIPAIFSVSASQILLGALQSLEIKAEPSGFGFGVKPYAGLGPILMLIDLQSDFFFLITGLFVAIPIFLYIVYSLFPYFLYAGVLLRSFTWTRSAGGSFLALFIAFYIIFPSILYPFSTYNPSTSSVISGLSLLVNAGGIFAFSLSAALAANPITGITGSFGNEIVVEINSFAYLVANLGLQALGLVIALIISLDLVETFGDFLGAPSMHTKKLLSKVI